MTAIINIFVALVLIFYCLKSAGSKGVWYSKHERLLVFILMTGMFMTGGYSFYLNLSAWRLLIWICVLIFVLYLQKKPYYWKSAGKAPLPMVLYVLFLTWCLYEWTRTPDLMYGLRAYLKLLYPFLVLLLARSAALSENFFEYLKKIAMACLIISIFTSGISEKIPYLVYNPLLEGIFWPRATFADHAPLVIAVILILLVYGDLSGKSKKRYMAGIGWLALSPLAVANRTGLLATFGVFSAFAVLKYKIKAIPFIILFFAAGVFLFTAVPSLRDSTFYRGESVTSQDIYEQKITAEDIDSSGRFRMWEELLYRLYEGNRIQGSGIGALQHHMYTYSEYYGGLKVPHSEYVTLLCDTGLVGFILYLAVALSSMFSGIQNAWFGKSKEIKAAGGLVFMSWIGLLCAMGFDNVFNYALAAHSIPFAFTGLMLGIMANGNSESISTKNT